MSQYRLLHLLLTSAASVAALSDCYLPNGTAFPLSAAYEPCIATENVFSMCCVLNVTALVALGESEANLDTCLPNGMCQPPAGVGGFTRDLCTDPTWKSPNCLNVCVGGSDGGSSSDTSFLTQCTDGSWCCGSENTACCNDNQGFQVAKAIPPYATAVSSSTGTTPAATGTGSVTSSTGTSTGSSSSSQTSQSGSSTPPNNKSTPTNGAEIGLGAALGVILIAVAIVGIYLWAKRRGANRGRVELAAPMDAKPVYPMTSAQQGVSGNGYPDQYKAYQPPPPQPPIQQHNAIHEISPQSQGYPAEMDGGAGKGKGMV